MTVPAPCWHEFCVRWSCDGVHHADRSGYEWRQPPGWEFCPSCRDYVRRSACGHPPEGPAWDYGR